MRDEKKNQQLDVTTVTTPFRFGKAEIGGTRHPANRLWFPPVVLI
jgi:hypothetical protein